VLNYLVSPDYNVRALEALERGAAKAGRTLDDIDRPQLVVCSVDTDRQAALDGARLLVTQYLGQQPHIMKASGVPQELLDEIGQVLTWPATHDEVVAASNGIPMNRVDEVLELVGMTDVADRKLRGYSLGMKQRLGLASTLLGDPSTMILDEPANGLDPEGIRWMRDFLRHYADQGRTVLVSSHLLSEMSLMAQDLIVIGKGRLIQQSSVAEFVAKHASSWVRVKSPQLPQLLEVVNQAGATVKLIGDAAAPDGADVRGLTIEAIGEAAHAHGIVLHELSGQTESLEDAFLTATASSQEYRSGSAS